MNTTIKNTVRPFAGLVAVASLVFAVGCGVGPEASMEQPTDPTSLSAQALTGNAKKAIKKLVKPVTPKPGAGILKPVEVVKVVRVLDPDALHTISANKSEYKWAMQVEENALHGVVRLRLLLPLGSELGDVKGHPVANKQHIENEQHAEYIVELDPYAEPGEKKLGAVVKHKGEERNIVLSFEIH